MSDAGSAMPPQLLTCLNGTLPSISNYVWGCANDLSETKTRVNAVRL